MSIIFRLKQAYGAGSHLQLLSTDLFEGLSNQEFQDDLVNALLHSPVLEQFPPSSESRRRFWKWAVTYLEASGEASDLFYTVFSAELHGCTKNRL
jgi:hypothetical protein